MRIIRRNGESIGRLSPLFVPPSQGAATKTCNDQLNESPWYRCSRKRKHKGDHAAHAGYGSQCVMVARWDNENENENESGEIGNTVTADEANKETKL